MKAIMAHGLSTVLAVVLVGPTQAADREQTRGSEFADFSQLSVQREPTELKLKLDEGKTYRWDIEAKPRQQGTEKSQASAGSMACKHQTEAKVTKASGNEATISFTFDASRCQFCKEQASKQGQKPPEKLTYSARVNQKGQVLSFEEEGGGGQGSEWKNMMLTQARELVGEGLHEGRLEPGKAYDVPWMRPESWQKGSKGSGAREPGRATESSSAGGESSGTARATARGESSESGSYRFEFNYDGRSRLEATQVACFTARSSGGSPSGAGSRAGAGERSSSESSGAGADRSIDGNPGGAAGSGGEAGKACFRLDDGFLEKFALVLPAGLIKEMHKGEEKKSEGAGMPPGDMLITIRRSQ